MKTPGSFLVPPRVTPVLDPHFRPAALFHLAFQHLVAGSGCSTPLRLALEQADGSVFHYETSVFDEQHPFSSSNFLFTERLTKFLLWTRGGFRLHFSGPDQLGRALQAHYRDQATGRFDAMIMGERIYERPFEVMLCRHLPAPCANTAPLGRHLNGCRIGFDLGGSDRKVSAVLDGKAVFTEETVWDPVKQSDPEYHFQGIMDSLRRAAAHLPRVDAIGGSAAGVYVNNRVKVASLFRGVPADLFESRVKNIFLEVKKAWGDIPLEVVNDGEVTALAGSMSLGKNGVLGLAMGTSQAGGYVTQEGNITNWLNELAFAPIDYNPQAPVDEWSGDYGCGVQYFSQQAVGRLIPLAGITLDPALPLPERLVHVQNLMQKGDYRAQKIYQTIGTYLGYAIGHYASFYDLNHLLVLGRVTSGEGGGIIVAGAQEVLQMEFPELSRQIEIHMPDEKDKRLGQAVAAASLPQF